MLTAIQRTQGLVAPQLSATSAPIQTPAQAPVSELRPSDSVQRSAAVGSIPATMNLFAASSAPAVDNALKQLAASPTAEAARKAQASFRVAIRSLDLKSLQALQPAIDAEVKNSADYRTQKLLADIQVDLYMEIHAKGGKPNQPALTMPALPGNAPDSIVHGSLKKLSVHMSEANYREARAGFRVALRDLKPADLAKTEALVRAAISTSSDYRTQAFLDDMLKDIAVEHINRGLNYPAPALNMPPALGKAPAEIAANAVKLLNSSSSEANFRTSVAAVRVAARDLDKSQLTALKAELNKAMQSTGDYRTQVYLDKVSREISVLLG